MRFTLACVFTLVVLSINKASSAPHHPQKVVTCENEEKTRGRQVREGSCSTTIQGEIPNVHRMVSTIIVNPPDHKVLPANKPFQIEILVDNLDTGFFSDPNKEYYVKPQELNPHGFIRGHSHITVQEISTDKPPNPIEFTFFKGLEAKAENGLLSADVVQKDGTPGLPPGKFRICTLTSSFSHQPVLMPVAKRGSQDDCIRIVVEEEKNEHENEKDKVGKTKDKVGKTKDQVGKTKDKVENEKDQVGKQSR